MKLRLRKVKITISPADCAWCTLSAVKHVRAWIIRSSKAQAKHQKLMKTPKLDTFSDKCPNIAIWFKHIGYQLACHWVGPTIQGAIWRNHFGQYHWQYSWNQFMKFVDRSEFFVNNGVTFCLAVGCAWSDSRSILR